jgi:hypothetical protein
MHARTSTSEHPGGRLPDAAYLGRRWRIQALTADFALEDVWELPGRGEAGDFPRLLELVCAMDPARDTSRASRALWGLRGKLGELFGWDDEAGGLDGRVTSLRDRLPEDLRDTAPPPFAALPFTSLYVTDDELAAEIANRTMHGVMHLGWVADGTGGYRAQMTVLVKPNGLTGRAYMAAIRPFRHLIVYPAMMRQGRALWQRLGTPSAA